MCPLRIFRAIAFVALGVAASACQPQRPSVAATKVGSFAAGHIQDRDARLVGARADAYFGDVFSSEEKALASKPPEVEAPGF
jgi:hypothetical protein